MKKRIVLALALVAAVSLTACGSTAPSNTAPQETSAQEETSAPAEETTEDSSAPEEQTTDGETVTLKVGMFGKDIKTACIILAQEMGYFEEEGVNVEFEQISSLPEAVTALSTGTLDVLPYGTIPSLSFISQGTDVVIFGGTISEGSEGITLPENKDKFKTAEDFKGKKIGCFRMETGHMVMKGYLREAGLDLESDVEFVYLDSQASIMEAVSKGEVDLGFVNSGYGYVCEQSGLEVAFQPGDFVADFNCCRQTTSRDCLDNKNDALVRFETAALRGYALYMNDHETAIEKLTAYSGQEQAYVEAIMYGTEDYDNAMIISLDPNTNKTADFYEVMKANGDIDAGTTYDVHDYMDSNVYYTALQNLSEREEYAEISADLLADYEVNDK